MDLTKLKVTGIDLDAFVDFIITKIEFDYENHGSDMTILMKEKYYFLGNDYSTRTLIVKKAQGHLLIHALDGYAFWSLYSFSRKLIKILTKHQQAIGFEFEEIKH